MYFAAHALPAVLNRGLNPSFLLEKDRFLTKNDFQILINFKGYGKIGKSKY